MKYFKNWDPLVWFFDWGLIAFFVGTFIAMTFVDVLQLQSV